MHAAGRPGRGERGRVAARVRELLAQEPDSPAARTGLDSPPGIPTWLPDAGTARHASRSGGAEQSRLRWRWDPGRRGAAALGVLLVAVIAVTGWWLAAGRPHEVPLAGPSAGPAGGAMTAPSAVGVTASLAPPVSTSTMPPSSTSAPPPGSTPPAPTSPGESLVVDVAGKVRRPGLYTLSPGARVDDAVRAAGGPRRSRDLVSLNLAQPVTDGEQIVVGGSGTPPAVAAPAGGTVPLQSSGPPTPVDLNTASLEQLETLPGIGPVLGQHILDYRSANGQFTSVDQLRDVSGIGDVRFAQLSPLVTL